MEENTYIRPVTVQLPGSIADYIIPHAWPISLLLPKAVSKIDSASVGL